MAEASATRNDRIMDDVNLVELAASAQGLVQPGEKVLLVVPAHDRQSSSMNSGAKQRGGGFTQTLLFSKWTPYRSIVITDRRILVTTRKYRQPSQLLAIVSEHPLVKNLEGNFVDDDEYVVNGLGKPLYIASDAVVTLNNLTRGLSDPS